MLLARATLAFTRRRRLDPFSCVVGVRALFRRLTVVVWSLFVGHGIAASYPLRLLLLLLLFVLQQLFDLPGHPIGRLRAVVRDDFLDRPLLLLLRLSLVRQWRRCQAPELAIVPLEDVVACAHGLLVVVGRLLELDLAD